MHLGRKCITNRTGNGGQTENYRGPSRRGGGRAGAGRAGGASKFHGKAADFTRKNRWRGGRENRLWISCAWRTGKRWADVSQLIVVKNIKKYQKPILFSVDGWWVKVG